MTTRKQTTKRHEKRGGKRKGSGKKTKPPLNPGSCQNQFEELIRVEQALLLKAVVPKFKRAGLTWAVDAAPFLIRCAADPFVVQAVVVEGGKMMPILHDEDPGEPYIKDTLCVLNGKLHISKEAWFAFYFSYLFSQHGSEFLKAMTIASKAVEQKSEQQEFSAAIKHIPSYWKLKADAVAYELNHGGPFFKLLEGQPPEKIYTGKQVAKARELIRKAKRV